MLANYQPVIPKVRTLVVPIVRIARVSKTREAFPSVSCETDLLAASWGGRRSGQHGRFVHVGYQLSIRARFVFPQNISAQMTNLRYGPDHTVRKERRNGSRQDSQNRLAGRRSDFHDVIGKQRNIFGLVLLYGL